jgi:hypothetical protein
LDFYPVNLILIFFGSLDDQFIFDEEIHGELVKLAFGFVKLYPSGYITLQHLIFLLLTEGKEDQIVKVIEELIVSLSELV